MFDNDVPNISGVFVVQYDKSVKPKVAKFIKCFGSIARPSGGTLGASGGTVAQEIQNPTEYVDQTRTTSGRLIAEKTGHVKRIDQRAASGAYGAARLGGAQAGEAAC